MEAFAAMQSAKRKKLAEMEASASVKASRKRSVEDELKLSIELGFLAPPTQVFAAGKDESAAVWWIYPNLEGVVGWQVHRYRRDRVDSSGIDSWQYKGFDTFLGLSILQINIAHLTNDNEYRFTVKAVNEKGAGMESPPTNAVMVEAPLPAGWYRFRDANSGRYYYASVKTNRSSWTRPELDPFFIDDALFMNFEPHEVAHLRELYNEDMAHYSAVSFAQFMDALREVGERCPPRLIKKLFKAYADNVNEIKSWQHYMEIMTHIKRLRMEKQSVWGSLVNFLVRKRARFELKPNRDKLGPWKVQFNELAARYYYVNSLTGETSWLMPEDVKFFLPRSLLNKLLKIFDLNDIEEFKQYFSMLDIDNSGDLSDKEIKLLLDAIGMPVSPSSLTQLVKAIDINGNGTVEFDEFCWLLYELRRSEKARGRKLLPEVSIWSKKKFSEEEEGEDEDEDEEDGGQEEKDDEVSTDRIDHDDDDDLSLHRSNAFGSGKWAALTFNAMRTAAYSLRANDSTSMAPSAPSSSPFSTRKSLGREDATAIKTALNTAQNSVQTYRVQSSPSLFRRIFCCAAKVQPAPPQVQPVQEAGLSSSPSQSSTRASFSKPRASFSEFSTKSKKLPVFSPSGKEYRLEQETLPWLDHQAEQSSLSGKQQSKKMTKDPRHDPSLKHGPHCMCGCRAY